MVAAGNNANNTKDFNFSQISSKSSTFSNPFLSVARSKNWKNGLQAPNKDIAYLTEDDDKEEAKSKDMRLQLIEKISSEPKSLEICKTSPDRENQAKEKRQKYIMVEECGDGDHDSNVNGQDICKSKMSKDGELTSRPSEQLLNIDTNSNQLNIFKPQFGPTSNV